MPDEDKMDIDERYKYLRIRQRLYRLANRKERGRMLDEMEQVTGLDRKTLIRQMKKRKIERGVRRRQRGKSYGAAVDDALRVIAETLDYICAERITPNLVRTAQHLALHGELDVSASVLGQLERISVSTVRRKLKVFARLDQWHLPRRKGPKPPNPVARAIEMRVIPWDEREPGHFEVDTVHHSGPCAGGDYVHTVQMTDVATEWCELAAALGRSQRVMEDAFRRMLARLPFPVREIHPDNGSEFLNHHLVRFWGEAAQGIQLSRSRPFHKNDNRFVEQKNFTLVRAYLGHERLDSVAQTLALNALYDKLWLPKVQLLSARAASHRQDPPLHPGRSPALPAHLRQSPDSLPAPMCHGHPVPRTASCTRGTARSDKSAKTPAGDLQPSATALRSAWSYARPNRERARNLDPMSTSPERSRQPSDIII